MNSLRIAIVLPLPPTRTGEVEHVLGLLARELTARGHEVTLLPKNRLLTNGAETPARDAVDSVEPCSSTYQSNGVMADLLSRSEEFDVIHCHLSPAYIPFGML